MESQFDVAAMSILSCYHAWQQSVRLASAWVLSSNAWRGREVQSKMTQLLIWLLRCHWPRQHVAGREIAAPALL